MAPRRRRADETDPPPPDAVAQVLAGRAFVRGRLQPVEIGISEDGWIVSVGKVQEGAPRRDFGDAILLPAATDLHVHFREPGANSDLENLATGTLQAALGGVALVGEMPNTRPPVTDLETLEEKERRVRGRAAVDVLLFAGVTNPRSLRRLALRAGAFKLFMSPTTGVPDPPEGAAVAELLQQVAGLGLPLSVHAEEPAKFFPPEHPGNPVEWNAHRPPAAERAAIDRLLPSPTGLRLHVAHVTTAETAARLAAANVSGEATPHHLLLNDRARPDAFAKVNPPLRPEATRRELFAAFARGEIPMLASDHAPQTPEDKERAFDLAPSGMPGVETMLPLMLAKVRASELSLDVLVAAACDRPARWFGQPHGRIAVGHRAHLMVVDFRARTRLQARHLHAPCEWTAFEGWEGIFPREVYFAGERVVAGGEYVGRPSGRVVRPEYARSAATPAPD